MLPQQHAAEEGEIPRVVPPDGERIKQRSAEQCRKHPEAVIRGDRARCESQSSPPRPGETQEESARTRARVYVCASCPGIGEVDHNES